MTEISWPVYVGLGVGSAASTAKIAIDYLSYRRTAPLEKAQERLVHSEAEVNPARAAGLMEDVYVKQEERRRAERKVYDFRQRIHIGESPPEDPREGDLWIDTST